jgi:hypothetical protein
LEERFHLHFIFQYYFSFFSIIHLCYYRASVSNAAAFLKEIREYQAGLQRTLLRQVTLQDVVSEEALPDIGTIGRAIRFVVLSQSK